MRKVPIKLENCFYSYFYSPAVVFLLRQSRLISSLKGDCYDPPKKRTRQFAALLIASVLSVSVSNSAVASAEEFQDQGTKGGFASGVMAELLGEAAPAITTYWASAGRKVRYPAGGGTWEYGFWNAKARSYFTVNRCHTSTVTVNGRTQRSINTRGGQKSIAELWATNLPGTKDSYYYNFC